MRRLSERLTQPAPYSQADPVWWCGPCADDLHELHRREYPDALGEWAACECPSCA